jgi:hypothetical protein
VHKRVNAVAAHPRATEREKTKGAFMLLRLLAILSFAAALPLALDAGSSMDPNGGGAMDPNGSSLEAGSTVDPDGVRLCYTACIDPNG